MFNGKLKAEIASLTAENEALKADNTVQRTNVALLTEYRRQDAERIQSLEQDLANAMHDLAVVSASLAAKVDQVTHYRETLQGIRAQSTPGANATVKRMARKADEALQLYAVVQAEAA
ncbi:hypothetical protein [Sphingomonas sp.]|uniref:hypothetical protein n=1 Tax=Sphingomonas sp. TaxID=28214 RepID=UPI002FD8A8C0